VSDLGEIWINEPEEGYVYTDDERIASLNLERENHMDDARLMGTAPELIERLVKRVENCHCRGDQYGSPGQCGECKADRIVINKAQGR
jgi:hypothetical protein